MKEQQGAANVEAVVDAEAPTELDEASPVELEPPEDEFPVEPELELPEPEFAPELDPVVPVALEPLSEPRL